MKKHPLKPKQVVAIIIFTLVGIAPALGTAGFFEPDFFNAHKTVITLIVLCGGFIAGTLFHPNKTFYLPASLGGAVSSMSIYWLTIFYAGMRSSIYKIELILLVAIGCLPGLLVYWFLNKKMASR